MKNLLVLILISLLFISKVRAQQNLYYIIVGGFKREQNAQQLTEEVLSLNYPAVYSFNPDRKLYYVYVRATINKDEALLTLKNVKQEGLRKAWMFVGSLPAYVGYTGENNNAAVRKNESSEPEKNEPQKEGADDPTTKINLPEKPVIIELPNTAVPREELVSPDSSDNTGEGAAKPIGKPFVFKLFNGVTGNPISGEVHLLESEKANQYRAYDGNETVSVFAPKNKNGKWYIACHVVGFKPYKKSFTYNKPDQGGVASIGSNNEAIIPIELTRVKKGDYIEMDQVKFFNNAAIFTPSSERELKELVNMMSENPNYKIRLHGHTNGEVSKDIISLGESQNLFAIDPLNKREAGSSKKLSTLRAEIVKRYLTDKGIDDSRIGIKGEGGNQTLFDPKGTMAEGNNRVEVEITKD